MRQRDGKKDQKKPHRRRAHALGERGNAERQKCERRGIAAPPTGKRYLSIPLAQYHYSMSFPGVKGNVFIHRRITSFPRPVRFGVSTSRKCLSRFSILPFLSSIFYQSDSASSYQNNADIPLCISGNFQSLEASRFYRPSDIRYSRADSCLCHKVRNTGYCTHE